LLWRRGRRLPPQAPAPDRRRWLTRGSPTPASGTRSQPTAPRSLTSQVVGGRDDHAPEPCCETTYLQPEEVPRSPGVSKKGDSRHGSRVTPSTSRYVSPTALYFGVECRVPAGGPGKHYPGDRSLGDGPEQRRRRQGWCDSGAKRPLARRRLPGRSAAGRGCGRCPAPGSCGNAGSAWCAPEW